MPAGFNPSQPHTIVVGGSSGTGLTVARYFADQGHRLSVIGRRPRPRNFRGAYFRSDITDFQKMPGLMARIVRRSGVWSNLIFVQRYRGKGDSWQGQWNLGINATRILIEAAAAIDQSGKKRPANRSVVLFNSVVTQFIAANQDGAYHAMQGALRQLVRYYAVRFGPAGIRVNSISPAAILKVAMEQLPAELQARFAVLAQQIPLRRMSTAQEIAASAFLLCQPAASYITGHDLVVDGGLSALAQEGLISNLTERG